MTNKLKKVLCTPTILMRQRPKKVLQTTIPPFFQPQILGYPPLERPSLSLAQPCHFPPIPTLCRHGMSTLISSPPSSPIPPPRRRTMDDIWKDISLSGLEDELSTRASKLGGINGSDRLSRAFLQEFLARPFGVDKDREQFGGSDHGSSPRHRGDHLSLPATALRLSSAPDRLHRLHGRIEPREASLSDPFEAINSSASRKIIMEDSTDISGDRRRQRMVKNRESAARSRARKQAYTNELEMEVAHLMEENARLRKKLLQQGLCAAAAASAQAPTKRGLSRSSASPF